MYRIGVVRNNSVVMNLWNEASWVGCRVYIRWAAEC